LKGKYFFNFESELCDEEGDLIGTALVKYFISPIRKRKKAKKE
jgi:hypothetical protein